MSAGDIDFLFKLWAASLAAHDDLPPFSNHAEMYKSIDLTPFGDLPWGVFSLEYNGDIPDGDIPSWMEMEYDVWFRDPRTLIHNLLSNPDFNGEFDYAPVQEYDSKGRHRFQNFMSGDWAWKQVVSIYIWFSISFLTFCLQDLIAKDPGTHGSMFVPVVLGSDKTTVSVATGHNEYWPVYMSIGNIHNNVRRAHRNGVVLLGFLAIPASKCSDLYSESITIYMTD